MARVKYGSMIYSLSGSVGGVTFQESSAGPVLRSKPLPLKSQTSLQLSYRSKMQYLENAWLNLSTADRDKWKYFLSWSNQSQKHNMHLLISGYQLFLKYQFARLTAGLSLLTSFVFQPLDVIPDSFILYNSGSTFYALFSDPVISSQYFFNLFLTIPVSIASAFRVNGLRFMHVSYHQDQFYYLINSYQAAFGILPLPGQQVNFRIYWFGITSPVLGYYQTGSKIIQSV